MGMSICKPLEMVLVAFFLYRTKYKMEMLPFGFTIEPNKKTEQHHFNYQA
jgi:hypothetical protein